MALEIAQRIAPRIPFIFVTGTLGEEVAIDMLKLGATDYVLKGRLARLVPAVSRALSESGQRREREEAEEKLRRSHDQLRALTGHLQFVREEERTRIAREGHDELGQALTGLKRDRVPIVRFSCVRSVWPMDFDRYLEHLVVRRNGGNAAGFQEFAEGIGPP